MSSNPPTNFESLDNPYVDQEINNGTSAPNCQPKHTKREQEKAIQQQAQLNTEDDASFNSSEHNARSSVSGADDTERSGRRSKSSGKVRKEEKEEKKMGYIQMAKMGYQELVNAIIRPPRADYKVG